MNTHRLYSTLLLAALSALWIGCGGKDPVVIQGEAVVPFPKSISAESAQGRMLPWADEAVTVREAVKFPETLPVESSDGRSPGLEAAGQWSATRQKLRQQLARRFATLPAAEPPPGESRNLDLGAFAQRRPDLKRNLRRLIDNAEQRMIYTEGGQGALSMKMDLEPVAREVLNFGGGFTPSTVIGQEALPRNKAQRDAMEQALEDLQRNVTTYEFSPEIQLFQWVNRDPMNRRILEDSLTRETVVTSEETKTEDGRPAWKVVREVDISLMLESAEEDQEEEDKKRRRAEKEAEKKAEDEGEEEPDE